METNGDESETLTKMTMQQAWETAVERVRLGERCKVDLFKRNMTVGGDMIVSNGKFVGTDSLLDTDDALSEIESLYASYKRSVPSEASENESRRHGSQFIALPMEELSDDDMMYGDRRDVAKARLESFVLLAAISGQLAWRDGMGKWFWKSPGDRDLVILKEWVQKAPEQNKTNTEK